MAQAYAAKSRVPYLMTYKGTSIKMADNISFEEFVPDSEDFLRVREQMKKEVQKIIVKHLDIFANFNVDEEHQYSGAMAQKSDVVSTFADPSESQSGKC